MQSIRIVEIPAMAAAYSGPLTDGKKFERFRAYVNVSRKPERYPMFHITSPGRLIPEGISIEDLYLPIEER